MSKHKIWVLLLIPLILVSVITPVTSTHFTPIEDRDYWPTVGWRIQSPESQGMNSTRLDEFWNHMHPIDGLTGLLLIRNGYLLYEAYWPGLGPDTLGTVASITKSISATILGAAIADGYVTSVNDSVLDYFTDRTIANPSPQKDAMTIWHLLTMSSGFESSAQTMGLEADWIQYVLDLPMVNDPGAVWNYDAGCSHLISAIITQTTGVSMATYAQARVLGPMGISVYEWPTDPQGITTGFGGLKLKLRDLAKFGYLFLNNGTWGPFQIVPAEWVAACTHSYFNFTTDGYGYQWWVDSEISGYSMRGAGGKRVFVLPEQDIVLVFAGVTTYSILDFYSLFEEFLFPAIIGDTMSFQQPVQEQVLPFVLVLLIIVIPLVVGTKYMERKRS